MHCPGWSISCRTWPHSPTYQMSSRIGRQRSQRRHHRSSFHTVPHDIARVDRLDRPGLVDPVGRVYCCCICYWFAYFASYRHDASWARWRCVWWRGERLGVMKLFLCPFLHIITCSQLLTFWVWIWGRVIVSGVSIAVRIDIHHYSHDEPPFRHVFFFRQMLFLEFLCVYNSMYPSSLNIIGLLSTLFWPKSTRFLWPWMVYISICGKEQFTFSSEFKQNVNFSDFLNSTHSSIDVNRFRVCRWCLLYVSLFFFVSHDTPEVWNNAFLTL